MVQLINPSAKWQQYPLLEKALASCGHCYSADKVLIT